MAMKVDTPGQVIYKASWLALPAEREVAALCWCLQWAADTAEDQVPSVRTSAVLAAAVKSWLLTASAAAAAEVGDGKIVMRGVVRR